MKIDSHQHFWKYNPVRDQWIDDSMQILKRDFMPEDLQPLLADAGFDGCVSVQADQSEEETHFLLNLAKKHDFIKGVVGWVDLTSPDLNHKLDDLRQFEKLKGFRHILQGQPPGTLLKEPFIQGIKKLQSKEFRYDILIHENQLPECIEFIAHIPDMYFVIDHIAKPAIKEGSFNDWAGYMKKLAEYPHIYVKLSGMVTEADWNHWHKTDFHPYIETCLEHFGADRLMIGSDWPVCQLAASYEEVMGVIEEFLEGLSQTEYDQIMGKSAVNFYQLSNPKS